MFEGGDPAHGRRREQDEPGPAGERRHLDGAEEPGQDRQPDRVGQVPIEPQFHHNETIVLARIGGHPNDRAVVVRVELDEAIQEMLDYDGPFILDVLVEKHENCFPMIPSGKPHNEMLLGEASTEGAITGAGGALV